MQEENHPLPRGRLCGMMKAPCRLLSGDRCTRPLPALAAVAFQPATLLRTLLNGPETRSMAHIFKLARYLRPYWKRSLAALALLTAVVFMDLAIPRLIERIIDQGIAGRSQMIVIQTSLIMLGISVLDALFAIGNNVLSVQVGEIVGRDLRQAIFLKIQSFSFGNLDRQKTGQLIVRLSSDTSALQRLIRVTLRIGTRAPLLMVGSLILMVATSRDLALTMLPLLLITAVIVVIFILRTEPLFRLAQGKLDRLNTVLQENIAGVRLVKAFVRAAFEGQRFESANEDYTLYSVRVMEFVSSMQPALTVFVNIGMVIVIYAGGLQAIAGSLTVGQIVAFTNYLLTTMTPLIMMTMLSNVWAAGITSARRVDEVLESLPDVQDIQDALPLPEPMQGSVAFENVSFHYNGDRSQPVLHDINLAIEPGQTVAFLGATGAGKSSLVNLVPRFYDVSAGKVTIDGLDVRQLSQDSLLAHIGVVPQESVLFSGTVRDNIRYGNPSASDDEVIAAAKAAQAHDFVLALPQGYDSHVEARGANLSGGQKQRLAIARALLIHPRVLILDDSTSSVDVETESHIQAALDSQQFSHTSLVVAQRISTVLRADKIVVIDRGSIVAEGTHQELMERSTIYREIFDSQLGEGLPSEIPGGGTAGEP
jgi:ATP-binding cassette subfamily B multidrug efflux pump